MDKLYFETGNGEGTEFTVEAQIRLRGTDYILVSGEPDEEGNAECRILQDISDIESDEAVYEEVEDDLLLETLMPLFEEELEDTDIE